MRKRFLGDTKHFCPVALRELGVLWPGDYDKAAVFRNKIYFFSKDEARDKFIKNPKAYVAGQLSSSVTLSCLVAGQLSVLSPVGSV